MDNVVWFRKRATFFDPRMMRGLHQALDEAVLLSSKHPL